MIWQAARRDWRERGERGKFARRGEEEKKHDMQDEMGPSLDMERDQADDKEEREAYARAGAVRYSMSRMMIILLLGGRFMVPCMHMLSLPCSSSLSPAARQARAGKGSFPLPNHKRVGFKTACEFGVRR